MDWGVEEVVRTAPIPKGTRVWREVRVLFSGQISVLVVYEFLCPRERGRRRGEERQKGATG